MRPTGKNADKLICVLQALLLAGFLPACGRALPRDAVAPDALVTVPPAVSAAPLVPPAPAAPQEAPGADADPDAEDIINWFNELALESEYPGSSETGVIRKWTRPVLYYITGDFTADDAAAVDKTALLLNSIEGFPGISPAPGEDTADMLIRFCEDEEFFASAGELIENEDADGAGIIRFNSRENEILKAEVFIRQSTAAGVRPGVIAEEIINCIGLGNDSLLRQDSLLYELADNNELSEMDIQIISLLYNPAIVCGMNAGECEEVLLSLLS